VTHQHSRGSTSSQTYSGSNPVFNNELAGNGALGSGLKLCGDCITYRLCALSVITIARKLKIGNRNGRSIKDAVFLRLPCSCTESNRLHGDNILATETALLAGSASKVTQGPHWRCEPGKTGTKLNEKCFLA